MKSCEVKVQPVRKHGVDKEVSRIGLLTLVALMILVLSTGNTMAATVGGKPSAPSSKSVVLWDISGEEPKPVDNLKKAESEKWVPQLALDAPDFKGAFQAFQKEPVKLVELTRNALLEQSGPERTALADLLLSALEQDDVRQALGKGRDRRDNLTEALKELANLAKSDPEAFEKLKSNKELLKKLFKGNKELLAALELTDKEPQEKESEKPVVDHRAEQAERERDAEAQKRRQAEKDKEELQKKLQEVVDRLNGPQGTPTEIDEGQIKAMAQPICDMWAEWKKQQQNRQADEAEDRAALNAMLNELYATHPPVAKKQPKKEDDSIDKAIEKLLNPEKQQHVAQAQPAPQSSASSPSRKRSDDEPQKTEATPPAQEPQQQPMPPMPKEAKRVNEPEITDDVPTYMTNNVNADVTNANNAVLMANNVINQPLPDQTNRYTGMPNNPRDIARKLGDQQTGVQMALSNLQILQRQITEEKTTLKNQIEVMRDQLLPPSVKEEENNLSAKADELERKAEKKQREFQMTGDPQAYADSQSLNDQAEEYRAALERYKKKQPIANKTAQSKLRRLEQALKNLSTSEQQVNEKLVAVQKRDNEIKDALQDNKDMAVAMATGNNSGNSRPNVGQQLQNFTPNRAASPRTQGLSGGPGVGRGPLGRAM